MPLAHMPANQPTNHTTTHLLYGHHAKKHTPRHSAVVATTTTVAPSTHARVARLRVVVKVSHLLVACGPLHSPVHASRLSSFKVYYVFAKKHREALSSSYGFIKADARLYLTRVYTSSCSACVDLVFTKFWVAISLHHDAAFPYLRYAVLRTILVIARRNVNVQRRSN